MQHQTVFFDTSFSIIIPFFLCEILGALCGSFYNNYEYTVYSNNLPTHQNIIQPIFRDFQQK